MIVQLGGQEYKQVSIPMIGTSPNFAESWVSVEDLGRRIPPSDFYQQATKVESERIIGQDRTQQGFSEW